MTLTADLRLPGIYFLPPPQAAQPALPPLDVAAFVGFAQRGPLHQPVPIEDVAVYRAIFGSDLALAHEEGGSVTWANLPAAVNLFFANGGRRCHVVRVAGKGATRTGFQLPGTVALPEAGEPRLATVRAAWPGRWSESLQLTTRLQWTPLNAASFTPTGAGRVIWYPGAAPDSLRPGDLLQVTEGDATWLVPIADITPVATTPGAFTLVAPQAWRVLTDPAASPPFAFDDVLHLAPAGPEPLDVIVEAVIGDEEQTTVRLSGNDVAELEAGAVLWLRQGADGGYLCPIAEIGPVQAAASPHASHVEVRAPHLLEIPVRPLPATTPQQIVRLRFDLLARDGSQRITVADLAFNGGHPRFWGERVYLASSALHEEAPAADGGRRARAAARFYHSLHTGRRVPDEEKLTSDPAAFAALFAPLNEEEAAPTFLPLGMLSVVGEADYQRPQPERLGDDALDEYNVDRFFDEALLTAGAGVLSSAAFDRLYIQDRRLRGLHSLFFVDEVALVSLPDAVHRAWEPAPPPAPADVKPWQAQAPDDDQFLVCQTAPLVEYVQPAQGSTLGGTLVTITGQRFTASEQMEVHFDGILAGQVTVADEKTLTCIAPPHAAPGPVRVTVSNWFGIGSKADAFTYLSPPLARLPLLSPASGYDEAPLRRAQRCMLTFCQARRDVVAILDLPAHYLPEDCLAWQDKLRQDFSLPPWGYTRSDSHELADLSYGAVYHPWLFVAESAAPDRLRAVPAAGAACGQIAFRERQRQVWVSPANQPLQGVLGLRQTFPADDQATLFEHGFNLPVREVGAFHFLSAHTLSDERAWQQLSVRRLLILLRKFVLERGMDYVFESNDERFRAGVQFALEELLQGMYVQGAFTGSAPQQAYRVTTGPDLNPPQSVDQGRFIAQIQVAPSQPLEFVTILLQRAGGGDLQIIES